MACSLSLSLLLYQTVSLSPTLSLSLPFYIRLSHSPSPPLSFLSLSSLSRLSPIFSLAFLRSSLSISLSLPGLPQEVHPPDGLFSNLMASQQIIPDKFSPLSTLERSGEGHREERRSFVGGLSPSAQVLPSVPATQRPQEQRAQDVLYRVQRLPLQSLSSLIVRRPPLPPDQTIRL